MASICHIHPANDSAAKDLSNWASSLNPIIAGSSHLLSADLTGSAVDRPSVEAELATCDGFLFFGHGGKARLQGFATDVVDLANISKVQPDSVIVAIACWSGVALSHSALGAGAKAYLGFDEQLVWLAGDPDKKFGPAVTSGLIDLVASGTSVSDCETRIKSEFDAVFGFYKTGAGSGKSNSILGWLCANWNKLHLVTHGAGSARF